MKTQSVKKNALLNILYTVSNILFPLITFPYVSRILQVELLGRVNFYGAFSSYAIMLASLGISTYGIRTVAKYRDNQLKLTAVTQELFAINLGAMLVVIVSIIVATPFIEKLNFDSCLLFINCILIVSSPFGMNWLFSGLEQYSYITKRAIVFKLISLILVYILVRDSDDYVMYALITVFSSVGAYICNFVYAGRFVSFRPVKLHLRQHLRPMMILFASILAVNIYTHLDTVMLGFICDDKQVGLYTIAVYAKTALLNVVNAISAVLLPRISYYYSEKNNQAIDAILQKSISIIVMLALPFTIFFILEASDSVMILGGESYMGAVRCMQITMPILLISGISNISGNQILIPLGRELAFMKAVVCGAIVNLLLNAILMPLLGCNGAAIATLCAEITQLSIQSMYAKEYLLKNINIFSIVKIGISGFLAGISGGVIKQYMIDIAPIIRILTVAFVYFLLYICFLFLFREKEIHLFCRQTLEKIRYKDCSMK